MNIKVNEILTGDFIAEIECVDSEGFNVAELLTKEDALALADKLANAANTLALMAAQR